MLNRQRQDSSLEVNVKDVNVVLREKEMDIVRIRREIEALRFAIPLLSDDRHLTDDETSELQPPKFLATGTAGRKGWRRRFPFMSR
jgi:hypothetical protein